MMSQGDFGRDELGTRKTVFAKRRRAFGNYAMRAAKCRDALETSRSLSVMRAWHLKWQVNAA